MCAALVQGGQLFCCVSIHGMSTKLSVFIDFLTELAAFQMPVGNEQVGNEVMFLGQCKNSSTWFQSHFVESS